MNASTGRSVRLFLAEGTASGLTTAEIMNWTGHVLAGSRSGLPAFLKRSELERTGIYFLIGPDPQDPGTLQVYIGESDIVRNRLIQHNKDEGKDFWERTCVVTSKDQNITKAHARYMEARLLAIARASGNASVVNATAPPTLRLPEADESDMEFFIEQLKLIFPVLGFDFLQQSRPLIQKISEISSTTTSPDDAPVFRLSNRRIGIKAEAREVNGEVVVLEGSTAVTAWNSNHDHSYAKQHSQLVESGKLVAGEDNRMRFTEDVAFRSPSAASAVIFGRPDNGRTSWKIDGSNISYGDWQSEQVAKAAADYGPEAMDS